MVDAGTSRVRPRGVLLAIPGEIRWPSVGKTDGRLWGVSRGRRQPPTSSSAWTPFTWSSWPTTPWIRPAREVWNRFRALEHSKAPWWKHTRWALLKEEVNLTEGQLEVLHQLRRRSSVLYRGWQLKEAIRDLYRLRWPSQAPAHLDWWLTWASRCQIPAFVKLAKTVRANRDRILAAVELGLSNSKLEGLNSKVRLINHRGYGHHSATALIAMIYLCCGGITVELPMDRVQSIPK